MGTLLSNPSSCEHLEHTKLGVTVTLFVVLFSQHLGFRDIAQQVVNSLDVHAVSIQLAQTTWAPTCGAGAYLQMLKRHCYHGSIFCGGLKSLHTPGKKLYTPPHFWPKGIFRGGGGVYILTPPPPGGRNFYTPPPLFIRTPPLEGYL